MEGQNFGVFWYGNGNLRPRTIYISSTISKRTFVKPDHIKSYRSKHMIAIAVVNLSQTVKKLE